MHPLFAYPLPAPTAPMAAWLAGASAAASLALLAPAQAAPPHTVPDTLAQRVLACTGCHGKEGRASNEGYVPRIAGKPAAYLLNQLRNFRDGRRSNAAMVALIDPLSDNYLGEIARHFAGLELPYSPAPAVTTAPARLERGRALVRDGDTARQVPACVRCHGAALTGVVPAIPGLLGLPRDYLVAQLGAWRSGTRHATRPDCMAQVAGRLSVDDIGALADWLASQPLPADPKPAPRIATPLPLDCGSGLT